MKVAVVQLGANDDKQHNICKTLKFVKKAISHGAEFIVLPEVFNFRGRLRSQRELNDIKENIPGESSAPFIELAKKKKIFILLGSLYENAPHKAKVYNTSIVIDSNGKTIAKYRKQNLFNAQVGSQNVKESKFFLKGKKSATVKVKNFKVGLTICYDLRFPQIYNNYSRRGVDMICVPSSFTHKTGQAHWEVLLRARAIENLCYILAPNQVGKDGKGIKSYGHSMIVGPWGEVLAKASHRKEEILYADINLKTIQKARRFLPEIASFKK